MKERRLDIHFFSAKNKFPDNLNRLDSIVIKKLITNLKRSKNTNKSNSQFKANFFKRAKSTNISSNYNTNVNVKNSLNINSKNTFKLKYAFRNKQSSKKNIYFEEKKILNKKPSIADLKTKYVIVQENKNLSSKKILKKNEINNYLYTNINYLNKNNIILDKKKKLVKNKYNSDFLYSFNKIDFRKNKKFLKQNNNDFSFTNNNYGVVDYCSSCVHHGIDWIYSSFYNFYFYGFSINYFFSYFSFLDESFDFFFFFFWFFSLFSFYYQLFFSFLLDYYVNLKNFNVFFFNEWSKFFFFSHETSIFYLYHPEALFYTTKILNFSYKYSTDFFLTVFNNNNSEVFFSPVITLLEIFFFFFLISIIVSFYFSNFLSINKEETLIDSDYLLATSFVESEKEISSLDDIILVLITFIFIFGWYFYINFIIVLNKTPELFLVFYFLPLAYFIIFGIPTFLMLDFGIFFLVYLKGVGSYSNLFIEVMFDYINVVIFYTRILVQGIRLVLMLFTYLSMNDLVLYFSFNQSIFLNYENIWETKNYSFYLLDNLTYFLFFSLPSYFIYWIYEILHTYFVVTVQFSAFFAIVFWLFLFLYTFFVIEKQENYFSEKRIKKKKQLYYLLNLKQYKN